MSTTDPRLPSEEAAWAAGRQGGKRPRRLCGRLGVAIACAVLVTTFAMVVAALVRISRRWRPATTKVTRHVVPDPGDRAPGRRRSPRERRRLSLRRRLRALATTLLGLVMVLGVMTARLFVWPPTHEPIVADAVVVLSGDHAERLPRALDLVERGLAPVLVSDGTPDSLSVVRLCRERQMFEVVCLRPHGDNTRTEAQAAGQLARARGWKTIVVVTSTQHATRARLHFDRCVRGRVLMVAARPSYGVGTTLGQIRHEWLGVLHALLIQRGC